MKHPLGGFAIPVCLPLALACAGCDPILKADNFSSWPANYREGAIPGEPEGDEVFIPELVGGGLPASASPLGMHIGAFVDCDAPRCDVVFTSAPIPEEGRGDPLRLLLGFDLLDYSAQARMLITVSTDDSVPLFYLRLPGSTGQSQVIHGGGFTELGRTLQTDALDEIVITPSTSGTGTVLLFGRTFPLLHAVGDRVLVSIGYEQEANRTSRLYHVEVGF